LTGQHLAETNSSSRLILAVRSWQGNIWLCGAWCGYGFHEDGIKAAVEVVKGMGGTIPWAPRPTSPYMTLTTRFVNASVHKMAGGAIKRGSIRLIMPNGTEVVYGNVNDAPSPGHKEGTRGALAAPCHTRVRVFDCNFFLRLAKDTDIGQSANQQPTLHVACACASHHTSRAHVLYTTCRVCSRHVAE